MNEEPLVPHTDDDLDLTTERPSLLRRLRVPLIVLAITATECLAVYLYFPSGSQAEVQAESAVANETAELLSPKPEKQAPPPMNEMDLGEFRITAFEPISDVTLRIEFHLWGSIRADDKETFASLMATREKRFRDEVIGIVRSADLTELTDSRLTLIKRRILETTNASLGDPLLKGVLFSEFTFVEQ